MPDLLGDRMKQRYEDRSRYFLPRRTYTIIRLDGKAFHTYTRGCNKPFDYELMGVMDLVTAQLCHLIQGAKFGYTQSDEISILLTDFEKISTDAYFDGNIQKISSISASMATAYFNELAKQKLTHLSGSMAFFDARVFTIPDPIEVANYFIWRQKDATHNAVSMAGQALYTNADLLGKKTGEVQEMIFKKGINFNDYPIGAKRGRTIVYEYFEEPGVKNPDGTTEAKRLIRGFWKTEEPPIFTQDTGYLKKHIPIHPDFDWKANVGTTETT